MGAVPGVRARTWDGTGSSELQRVRREEVAVAVVVAGDAGGCVHAEPPDGDRTGVRVGARSALFFEDDALLAPDFGPRLGAFLGAVPGDWHMLYLGGQHRPRFGPLPVCEGVVRCRQTIRMHAYAVHERGARAVHDHLARAAKICDQALADLHPRLPTYAPTRWMAAQRADFSDVESRRHEKDRWWE